MKKTQSQTQTQNNRAAPPPPRSVSPARNPPSNSLYIVNFVRPFTQAAVKELLSQDGAKLKEFGMNFNRSKCFAVVR